MKKLVFLAFCLLTGSLHAQKPLVFSKCNECDTVLQVWHYTPTSDAAGIRTEFFENEQVTESYFFDYDKNEVVDFDGHTYNIAYDIFSTPTHSILYFDGYRFEIFYTQAGRYIGHTKKPLP